MHEGRARCQAPGAAAAAGAGTSEAGPLLVLELPEDVLHRVLDQLLADPRPSDSLAAALQHRRAARLAGSCRCLRRLYHFIMAGRPAAALHAEAERATAAAKRRLVRRLTLDQHRSFVRREVAAEFGLGAGVLLLLAGVCGLGPSVCLLFDGLLNFVAFTLIHMMIHTAMQAAACRACASLGTRWAPHQAAARAGFLAAAVRRATTAGC
jgi:hypothetical protein